MAYIEGALRTRALAHEGTAALIAARFYAAGEVPQGATLPLVSAQRISGIRQHAMGADTGLVMARVQINVVAASYTGVLALAEQIRGAFQDYTGTSASVVIERIFLDGETDLGFDQPGEAHSRALDFQVWFQE